MVVVVVVVVVVVGEVVDVSRHPRSELHSLLVIAASSSTAEVVVLYSEVVNAEEWMLTGWTAVVKTELGTLEIR